MLLICKFLLPVTKIFTLKLTKNNDLFINFNSFFHPVLANKRNKYVLIYKNFFYFLFFAPFWTTFSHIKKLFHQAHFVYHIDLKLIGRGYKFFFLNTKKIEFKIGINLPIRITFQKSLIWVKLKRCRYDTQIFQIKSNSLLLLTSFIAFLRRLKAPDAYKGKGFRFRRERFQVKYRKKYGSF